MRTVMTPDRSEPRAAVQIVRRIADYRLIQIANLDFHTALRIRHRPDIAGVAIAADPHGRALRQRVTFHAVEPLVKLAGAASHIGVG
jgi:hypothetical protein